MLILRHYINLLNLTVQISVCTLGHPRLDVLTYCGTSTTHNIYYYSTGVPENKLTSNKNAK